MTQLDRQYITNRIIDIMRQHVGADNGISADNLYYAIYETHLPPAKRNDGTRILRSIIKEQREQGIFICASPSSGYYMPKNYDELREYLRSDRRKLSLQYLAKKIQHQNALKRFSTQSNLNLETKND